MTLTTLAILGFAFSLDLLIGEPRSSLHPVAWFGRLVGVLDREWSPNPRTQRRVGILIAFLVPMVPAAAAWAVVTVALGYQSLVGAVAAALVLFSTTSLRLLLDLTQAVIEETDDGGDLEVARERVRGLVGRETDSLTGQGLRSAAIESAAENLSDGFAATLLPFALLAPVSLPAAAAVAAWIKGVNTLDSMLGYPSKPIGTASARLDDFVMYLPARVTAVCLALASFRPRTLARARECARVPASPNAGWPMAVLAYGLGVRLEKPDAYVLNAGGTLPTVQDGNRAVSMVGLAAAILVAVAAALAVYAPALEATLVPIADGLRETSVLLLERFVSGVRTRLEVVG